MISRRILAAVFVLMLALAVIAVWTGGAWRADVAGDPDEPAHAVTSLMLRDFVAGAEWTRPTAFAKAYYEDFPKIALGHYPPGYYVFAGAVLLLAPSLDALLCFQAVLLAVLGTLVFVIARKIAGLVPALCAAIMSILLPLMWRLSLHVMADLLLVCFCLAAVLCWARYCDQPSKWRALAFGLVAALAILTKGSGLMLAVVPPLVVLLRQEWRMLRSWSWWLAPLPVLLLAAPWMLLTAGITKEGMTGQTTLEFLAKALPYYGEKLPQHLGYVWLALATVGAFGWLRQAWKGSLGSLEAALLAGMAGGAAVILLVPAGLSERYLAPMVPALAILAVVGARAVSHFLPPRWHGWAVLALAVGALAPVASIPQKAVSGFADAVAHVQSVTTAGPKERWLVSSDPRGEGGIIVEAAFRLQQRSPSPLRVYRAGKELSSSDWMGRHYQSAFSTEAEILAHLDKLEVSWVFLDLSVPERLRVPHEKLLQAAMGGAPDRWTLERRQPITRQPGVTGELLIYRSVVRSPEL